MNLYDKEITRAVTLAKKLYSKLTTYEQCLPIEFDDAVKYFNVDIVLIKEDMAGLDGSSSEYNGKYLITIDNVLYNEEHQRFSSFHELGHIALMHHTKYSYIASWIKDDAADAFAAEILMPSHYAGIVQNIDKKILAKTFNVSGKAIERRFKTFNLKLTDVTNLEQNFELYDHTKSGFVLRNFKI